MRAVSEYNYKRYFRKVDPKFELTPDNLVKMVSWDQLTHTLNGASWWWTVMCKWDSCKDSYCQGLEPKPFASIPASRRLSNAIKALQSTVDVIHCLEHGDSELLALLRQEGVMPQGFALPHENANPHYNSTQITRAQLRFLQLSSIDYQLYVHFCGDSQDVLDKVLLNEE